MIEFYYVLLVTADLALTTKKISVILTSLALDIPIAGRIFGVW